MCRKEIEDTIQIKFKHSRDEREKILSSIENLHRKTIKEIDSLTRQTT